MTLIDTTAPATDVPAAAGTDAAPAAGQDFDPAAVDRTAFTKACQAAARPHKAKIIAARLAGKAKFTSLLFITIPATVVLVALICLCVAAIFSDKGGNAGKGIGGLMRAIGELWRWAERLAYRPYWDARRAAKVDVLTQTFPALGLTYARGSGDFPMTALRATGIAAATGQIDDYVAGRHKGVAFQLCERVPAERKGEAPRTPSEAGWQGVMMAFDIQKSFTGRTVIVRDGGAVGNLFKGIGKAGERVKLEDPRFEKVFEVFGTDQVEARYLLTPAFMERMVDLNARFGSGNVKAAFADGKLFVVIDASRDHFELGLDDGDVCGKSPAKVLRDLLIPCKVIASLKLDAKTVA